MFHENGDFDAVRNLTFGVDVPTPTVRRHSPSTGLNVIVAALDGGAPALPLKGRETAMYSSPFKGGVRRGMGICRSALLCQTPPFAGKDKFRDGGGSGPAPSPIRGWGRIRIFSYVLSLCGKFALMMFCFSFLWGCGYRLVGKETHLPPGIASLAVPTFGNQTLEPGVEIGFTQAFLKEFIRDRRITIVNKAEADAVLEGAIKSIHFQSVSYDAHGLVQEYQTIVTVDLVLKGRGGEILWRENGLTESRWYRTTSKILQNEFNRAAAIQDAASLMAERVRQRFFYNF